MDRTDSPSSGSACNSTVRAGALRSMHWSSSRTLFLAVRGIMRTFALAVGVVRLHNNKQEREMADAIRMLKIQEYFSEKALFFVLLFVWL